MPIGTSDGEHFPTEMDYVLAAAPGFRGSSNVSGNVEDDRTQADRWGDAFGPAEGGPPVGINPREWYNPKMQQYSPIVRQAILGITNQMSKPQEDEIVVPDGLTSEEDLIVKPQYVEIKKGAEDTSTGSPWPSSPE